MFNKVNISFFLYSSVFVLNYELFISDCLWYCGYILSGIVDIFYCSNFEIIISISWTIYYYYIKTNRSYKTYRICK